MADEQEEKFVEEKSHEDAQRESVTKWLTEFSSLKKTLSVKKGDYVIQCHVIEARDVKGRGANDMSDPVCVVLCMGQKKTTRIHKETLNPVFDQVLFFEFKDLEPAELERGKIQVAIYDANTIMRNEMIGAYEFDLLEVHCQKHHEFFRQWVALDDPTDKFEGIQAYLRCTIAVLGPGEELYIHTEYQDEEDEGMLQVLQAPHIERHGKLLKIQVFEVQDLPVMDDNLLLIHGGADPYVQIEFAGITQKSKPAKGMTTDILREIQIPVMEPILGKLIKCTVFDYDHLKPPDRIATTDFDYRKAKEGLLGPHWVNLYGAPHGMQTRRIAKKMNRGLIEATTFRGRVLFSLTVIDEDQPKKDEVKITALPERRRPPEDRYVLQFDLYEATEICVNAEVRVEVCIGPHTIKSEPKKPLNGQVRWYTGVTDNGNDLIISFPKDMNQCPDVIVYLCVKERRFSYRRMKFVELFDAGWEVAPKWYTLKEDKAIDGVQDDEFPGCVLFSIRLGYHVDAPDTPHAICRPWSGAQRRGSISHKRVLMKQRGDSEEMSEEDLSEIDVQSMITARGDLRVSVLRGRRLPAVSKDGTSSPFVRLQVRDEVKKTKTQKNTLSPDWSKESSLKFEGVHIRDTLHVDVVHEDRIKNTRLGRFSLTIRNYVKDEGVNFETEQWFLITEDEALHDARVKLKIKFEFDKPDKKYKKKKSLLEKAGKLLLVPQKSESAIKVSKHYFGEPKRTQYQFRAYVYQGRNFPATDYDASSDPYLKIRCGGKVERTETKKKALNPLWYQVILMNVALPKLELAADIQIEVFDEDVMSKDDLVGRVSVSCADAAAQFDAGGVFKAHWFKILDMDGNPRQGEILLAFEFLKARTAAKRDIPDLRPATQPMYMHITTLGLRSLNTLLTLQKPFIEFHLPNGTTQRTKTSNIPSSSSPNFLQHLRIPIEVPIDKLFAPSMQIEVKDSLFGGILKRSICTADVNLEEFMIDEDEKAKEVEEFKTDFPPSPRGRGNSLVTRILSTESDIKLEGIQETFGGVELPALESLSVDEPAGMEMDSLLTTNDDLDVAGTRPKGDGMDKPLLMRKQGDLYGTLGGDAGESGDEAMTNEHKIDIPPERIEQDESVGLGDFFGFGDSEEMKYAAVEDDLPPYMIGRKTIKTDLEKDERLDLNPWYMKELNTGQINAIFTKFRKVGLYKGLISLTRQRVDNYNIKLSEILVSQNLVCRLYILRGLKLVPKDSDGTSDPYLKIKLGKYRVDTRDRYIKNSIDPEFFESFEIPCVMPGDNELVVEVWDWDGFGDDLIGVTTIDIEDRWFSADWRGLTLKPLEMRTLRNPACSFTQGTLELFLEVLPTSDAKKKSMHNIKPPPPEPYELRVIIWETKDVTIKDTITEQNDLYVTGVLDVEGCKKQKTDTHFRSKGGKGTFNWRFKFTVDLPMKRLPRFRIQIWDKDLFSPNDSICEVNLSLATLFKKCVKKKDRVVLKHYLKEEIWLDDLSHPNFEGNQGSVLVSIECMPASVASQLPAGYGRSDPNTNPFLPPPEGRMELSLNPFTMAKEILGANMYKKLCGGACCIICVAMLVVLAPLLFTQFLGGAVGAI